MDNVVGHNIEKDYQLEKLYSMAYAGINSLEKNYIKVNEALNAIKKLEDH